jgi:PIN domain nuclease of toxin-antitoxin system
MSAVVVDTHALLWYLFDPNRLSPDASNAFDQAATSGDPVYLSSISLIELRYLIEKRTFVEGHFTAVLDAITSPLHNLKIVSVDFDIVARIGEIPRNQVPDMPDRIIAATALVLDLLLVTRDLAIRTSPIKTIW